MSEKLVLKADFDSCVRLEVLWESLVYMAPRRVSPSQEAFELEREILTQIRQHSRATNEKIPGTGDYKRVLDKGGEIAFSAEAEDLIVDYIQRLPWSVGQPTRRALNTLRWLRPEIGKRRLVRKALFLSVQVSSPDSKRFVRTLYEGFLLTTLAFAEKSLSILQFEESILDIFHFLMRPCPEGATLAPMRPDEPCMVLSKDGILEFDSEQSDRIVDSMHKTRWSMSKLDDYHDTMTWLKSPYLFRTNTPIEAEKETTS